MQIIDDIGPGPTFEDLQRCRQLLDQQDEKLRIFLTPYQERHIYDTLKELEDSPVQSSPAEVDAPIEPSVSDVQSAPRIERTPVQDARVQYLKKKLRKLRVQAEGIYGELIELGAV